MAHRATCPEKLDRLRRLRDGGHLRYILYGVAIGIGYALVFAVVISSRKGKSFFDVLPWTVLVCAAALGLAAEIGWRFICSRCKRDERGPPA